MQMAPEPSQDMINVLTSEQSSLPGARLCCQVEYVQYFIVVI